MNELMINRQTYLLQLLQWNSGLIYAQLSHSFSNCVSKGRNDMHVIVAVDVGRLSSEQLYESVDLGFKLLYNLIIFKCIILLCHTVDFRFAQKHPIFNQFRRPYRLRQRLSLSKIEMQANRHIHLKLRSLLYELLEALSSLFDVSSVDQGRGAVDASISNEVQNAPIYFRIAAQIIGIDDQHSSLLLHIE